MLSQDASSSSHVRRAVSFADSIDTAQGHSPPTAFPQSNGGEKHDTPTELPVVRSRKPRMTDALPTPPPSAMSFCSMAAVSPFIVCTSPRPIPELPSLTQSLSTAASSTAVSFTPSASFAASSSSPSQSLQIVTDDSQAALLSTEDTALSSPITLNLTEPRSPDSAHFSPAHDIIAFASPASSQFELCDPAVQYEARHPVTFDSHGSPGSISTREPPSGEYESPSPRSPPGRLGMDGNNFDPTSLYQPPEQRPLLPDADACPPKRSFLHKVRKLGGRIKRLLKGGTHDRRAHSASPYRRPSPPALHPRVRTTIPKRTVTYPPALRAQFSNRLHP
ncbi:hypothetical protein EWM64_g6650 [Hericium alpestre]|uniref:Uncharacterized protein n=1 Tax=Hericium alpestre TaxID=135208 RepID=A0A4Y9ZRF5_9AGAM|nr:hypothetical protein EWM64_g6650 [Hericium alpestre]